MLFQRAFFSLRVEHFKCADQILSGICRTDDGINIASLCSSQSAFLQSGIFRCLLADYGSILAGRRADVVLLEDAPELGLRMVIKGGKILTD